MPKCLQIVVVFCLFCAACSGDSVKVSTASNNGIESGGGPGFTAGVAASSAGGQAIDVGSGGQGSAASVASASKYTYQTFENDLHTFCLETSSDGTVVSVLRESGETELVLESAGCGAVELRSGSHTLLVLGAENDSVERVPNEGEEGFFTRITTTD